MKLREKSIIVLEGLFQGQIIKLDINNTQFKIKMDNNSIVMIAERFSIDPISKKESKIEDVYLGTDFLNLTTFINCCNKLSDDEVAIIAANTALNKSRKVRK